MGLGSGGGGGASLAFVEWNICGLGHCMRVKPAVDVPLVAFLRD